MLCRVTSYVHRYMGKLGLFQTEHTASFLVMPNKREPLRRHGVVCEERW